MKKTLLIILFALSFSQLFAQKTVETELVNLLDKYTTNLTSKEDSLFWKGFEIKFEQLIKDKNITNFDFKQLKAKCDTSYCRITVSKSEDGNFMLFRFAPQFYNLNYITKAIKFNGQIKSYQIVLKDNKWHEYFTEIHNLNDNEFLLIEQRDDLVFSCNYASVFEKKGNTFTKKKAFENKIQLTVCNFTEIEEPVMPNDQTNSRGHYSLPARKITFDYKNKTISYGSCTNPMTGKTVIGKAKYISGNFKIKDCDERKMYD